MSRSVSLVLLLSLTVAGCSIFRKRANAPSQDPVTVQVINNNWSDMVIYALVNGTRTRLGDVSASRSAVLTLPSTLVSSSGMLQLVLDPLGSRNTFRTGMIMVSGGQRVRLSIENELRLTTWTVR